MLPSLSALPVRPIQPPTLNLIYFTQKIRTRDCPLDPRICLGILPPLTASPQISYTIRFFQVQGHFFRVGLSSQPAAASRDFQFVEVLAWVGWGSGLERFFEKG